MEITTLIGIITKLKTKRAIFCTLYVIKYENFKVKSALFNLRCEALGIQTCELTKWWEEVQDMFKEDLQQVL
jgi:hypothetical protein